MRSPPVSAGEEACTAAVAAGALTEGIDGSRPFGWSFVRSVAREQHHRAEDTKALVYSLRLPLDGRERAEREPRSIFRQG